MAGSGVSDMVDTAIFEHLQAKIDEDAQVREEIRNVLQVLERQGRSVTSLLSRAHSTPSAELSPTIDAAQAAIEDEISTISQLSQIASNYPYYKSVISLTEARAFQLIGPDITLCGLEIYRTFGGLISLSTFAIVLCGWLGGYQSTNDEVRQGRLLTIEEVGQIMKVPVNLKDKDDFHLTIEEYLHSLINVIEELARLAVNSVTLGDFHRPLEISRFVKELHAGFQILNLKNDSLRRRSDSIKYNVKKIEDVVYDLSLRNLLPRNPTASG